MYRYGHQPVRSRCDHNHPVPYYIHVTADSASLPQINRSDGEAVISPQDPVQAKTFSRTEYAPDRLLVRFKTDRFSSQDLTSAQTGLNARAGASVLTDYTTLGIPGLELVRLGTKNVTEAVSLFEKSQYIEYAEPDYLIRTPENEANTSSCKASLSGLETGVIPNDTNFDLLWGLHNTGSGTSGIDINAPDAWGATTGSEDVVIEVIDSDVDYTHPDLAANMWINKGEIPDNGIDDDGNGYIDDYRGYTFDLISPDPMATNMHGAHCAGTIGAVGNNGIGVCGVNWHTRIMPLNTFNVTADGSYLSSLVEACLYADKMGARITSNSYGGNFYSQAFYDAINASHAITVCAAMNDASDNDQYPVYPASFNCSNILSVAALQPDNTKWWLSNYGKTSVDLMAPGSNIYSTSWPYQYQYSSGTSMATPHVAGLAGLILGLFPNLTNQEVIDRIMSTTDPVNNSDNYPTVTNGRVNAAQAIYWNTTPEVESVTPSTGVNNHTMSLVLSGKNLFGRTTVNLTRSGSQNISARQVTALSPEKIICMVPLTGVSSGSWDVAVTNPYGQTFLLPGGFSVSDGLVLPPVVRSITPDQGQAGTDVAFSLTGDHFDYMNCINLSREGMANITTVGTLQGDNLTGTFQLPYIHTTYQWNVSVYQGGRYSVETVPFTIRSAAPAPDVSAIVPENEYNTRMAAIAIKGYNFADGCRAELIYPEGWVIPNDSPVIFVNSSFVHTTFDTRGVIPGSLSFKFTNPDGQEWSGSSIFTIHDGWDTRPGITDIVPSLAINNTNTTVVINGSYGSPEMEVYLEELYSYNPCIINRSPVYDDKAGTISATLAIQGLPAGSYDIRLMNTTSGADSLPFPFSIVPPELQINASSDRWTLTCPTGIRTYPARANATYMTQAQPGSTLTDVLVNEASVGSVPSRTFTDLNSDQTIRPIGEATPGQVQVFFNASPRNGTAPLTVTFHDNSLGDPTSFLWHFGDGSGNVTRNPDHTYMVPGNYTVSLKAMNSQSSGTGTWYRFIAVT